MAWKLNRKSLIVLLWGLVAIPVLVMAMRIEARVTHNNLPTWHGVQQRLQQITRQYPESTQLIKLGQSSQGQDLIAFKLIGAKSQGQSILIAAAHHGDEPLSTWATLAIIFWLVNQGENHTSYYRPQLAQYDFYILPVVNVDGYDFNSRYDAFERDLNRDYDYPQRPSHEAFQTPEIRALKKLIDRLDLKLALSFHTGMEAVLWPWAYSAQPTPYQRKFVVWGQMLSQAMGIKNYRQSFHDYASFGEFIDYVFWKKKTLAFTIELGPKHSHNRALSRDVYVRRALAVLKRSLSLLQTKEHGLLATAP